MDLIDMGRGRNTSSKATGTDKEKTQRVRTHTAGSDNRAPCGRGLSGILREICAGQEMEREVLIRSDRRSLELR